MDDEILLRRKLMDLANRSYNSNIYTYSDFLSINELSVYNSMKKELSFVASHTFGGSDACQRQLVIFGDYETLGYTEEPPIRTLRISPLTYKFAEELSHRDYLGALMNLGITRDLLGDIIIRDKDAYLFCLDHICEFIIDNLDTIKHTHVKSHLCTEAVEIPAPELKELEFIAASPRVDAVVASITKQSRSSCNELFAAKMIFVNGSLMENKSYNLKPGDILVIRGEGKFIYNGCGNKTRKGRIYIKMQQYI